MYVAFEKRSHIDIYIRVYFLYQRDSSVTGSLMPPVACWCFYSGTVSMHILWQTLKGPRWVACTLTMFSTALLVLTHAPVFLFSITPRCHFTPKSLNSSCCSDPFILLDKTSLEKASCFKSMPGHKGDRLC